MVQHHQDREQGLLSAGLTGGKEPSHSASPVKLRHKLKAVLCPGENYYSFTDTHSFLTQLIVLPKSKTFLHTIPLHKETVATALQAMQRMTCLSLAASE